MTDKLIDRLYNAGMQFAGTLRLLGKHAEAHEVELMVLALQAELRG
jgi:hypothetical protein